LVAYSAALEVENRGSVQQRFLRHRITGPGQRRLGMRTLSQQDVATARLLDAGIALCRVDAACHGLLDGRMGIGDRPEPIACSLVERKQVPVQQNDPLGARVVRDYAPHPIVIVEVELVDLSVRAP